MSEASPEQQPGATEPPPPLAEAIHSDRDIRQRMLRGYQDAFGCRIVVVAGPLSPASVTLFEDALIGADPSQALHVMLDTPGGHGESAIRMARQAQARCSSLTVIVPNQAKSAGTLFALGADRILMGPSSDLGPVDPQIRMGDGSYRAARAIIETLRYAEHAVQAHPETFPLHVSMLEDFSGVEVQFARDALEHAGAQVRTALRASSTMSARGEDELEEIAGQIEKHLVSEPRSHEAIVTAEGAQQLGLPVEIKNPDDVQWELIWQLWTRYFRVRHHQVYEGAGVSHVFPLSDS